MTERLIKSKERVQKHGEVFTPEWMVKKMLDTEGIKEACETLETTFLEPACGEGAFLIEILQRKLSMVERDYAQTIGQYEQFSLFALSTLYGVELLEDNAQICVVNLIRVYDHMYRKQLEKFGTKPKTKVLKSAATIASHNIREGNFLTGLAPDGNPITFYEWKPTKQLTKRIKTIQVTKTAYTLEEIRLGQKNEPGTASSQSTESEQLSLFEEVEAVEVAEIQKYATVPITDVFQNKLIEQEGEEDEQNTNPSK